MRKIIDEIQPWFDSGQAFALATVIKTWSSAPRSVGAAMAVSQSGEVVGSVSGGCVESAIYETALEVLKTGHSQIVTYGVSDDNGFAVGLTCGGTIELFIQIVTQKHFPQFQLILDAIKEHRPIAIATLINGPGTPGARMVFDHAEVHGTFNIPGLDHCVVEDGRGLLRQGITRTLKLGPAGERMMDEVSIFVESYALPPKMILFGAMDFAIALAQMGKFLGYHVTVCDARVPFANKKRFPEADHVVVDWPHRYLPTLEIDERTVICVLTHDPKFDVPVLEIALRTNAGYVGAIGSRRTHEDRLGRLREIGMTESELARLHSPIGLDIGSRTPEETAISIAAEIISDMTGGTRQPLSEGGGPIHKISLTSEKSATPAIA
ncbi:MAG: XdhC family protein [Candidatus Nanopelagicaceae bacterium]|nr:XdhC family protein [Candidatus Nanopelagicaceae bacterium]